MSHPVPTYMRTSVYVWRPRPNHG